MFASYEEIASGVAELLRPPSRISVAESAEKFLRVKNSSGTAQPWDRTVAPYISEPMNRLSDRNYEGVVFVGPAQTGKTEALILGWMAHSILSEHADFMVVQMTQHEARDFAKRRVDKSIQMSPALSVLVGTGHNDNVFDKQFKNGTYLNIGWPTVSQLSSKPIRHIALTDYDRFPPDIDCEGDAFGLARNRTKSFMSRGRILAESTPGYYIKDADYRVTGHEAPPADGIMSLYNIGTRHRLYWPCPECGEFFLADWENIRWDTSIEEPLIASRTAYVACPVNGCVITHDKKNQMNQGHAWRSEAEVFGNGRQSKIASYWMQGPAAAFQKWESLVYNYLVAMREFESTGNQEKLKQTINTDQGRSYLPVSNVSNGLDSVILKQRAESGCVQKEVPAHARFVTAAVDVQQHRFVVQVQAWGANKESWIVDRYNLVNSDRIGEDGARLKVSPFTHPEDWSVLDKVLNDEYKVSGTDKMVQARLVVCDSGGSGDATTNAYGYASRLRRLGNLARFVLLKGASRKGAPRLVKGKPGDDRIKVPLYIVNTTLIKDEISASLMREEVGPGYIHLPDWIGEWFFKELSAEVWTPNGWVKRRKADNNEAFDLCGYSLVAYYLLGGDKINWDAPPAWCASPLGDFDDSAKSSVKKVGSQDSANTKFASYLREHGRTLNGD